MPIDKKQFWEDKIIGWEDIRYKRDTTNFNIFENFVNRTNKTLIYRLNTMDNRVDDNINPSAIS